MNIRTRAAVQTLVMVVSIVAASFSVAAFLEYFQPTATQIGYALGTGMVAFFVYLIYSINLSHLQFKQRISDNVETKEV